MKSKQSFAQVGGSKAVESAVKDVDTECFPDIEVMSTKLEHDECEFDYSPALHSSIVPLCVCVCV